MKKLFILFCLLSVPTTAIFACGPYYRGYLPSQYCMFRICGDNMNGHLDGTFGYDKNCVEWAWITSTGIPMKDIYEVVYKWSIEQLQSLKNGKGAESNSFAKWLSDHKDIEIMDFLILAKRNEQVRGLRCTYWYYEDEEDEVILNGIVNELKAYKGSRLRDRYTLQLVRALFTLGKYEECVNLWKSNGKFFKTGVIKDMTVDYIAGAYEWLGNEEMKMNMLNENGMGHGKVSDDPDRDKFDKMYEAYYDRPQLWYYIQSRIHKIECDEVHGIDSKTGKHYLSSYDKWTIEGYTYWYDKVLPIIEEGGSKEMARWYYTAAFLADKLDKTEEARSFLRQAEECGADGDMKDAIHALKIYFNVKDVSSYNQEFEEYLYGELKWLDRKMSEEFTDKVKTDIDRNGYYCHNSRMGLYYWDDVMRKILLGTVVPLCLRSNYQTRALQYLNMADNSVFIKAGEIGAWSVESLSAFERGLNSEKTPNWHDYRGDYFVNLDTLDVKYAKRMIERMENPQDNLDRLIARNSHFGVQYLYDIIGTKLIRDNRFGEAITYLGKVSDAFQESRSVYEYFDRDPFSSAKYESPDPRYKLHFAQEMMSLEQKIATTTDPNDRAEAILKYCRGLYSDSGERCWALTDYFIGTYADWDEIRRNDIYRKTGERADRMLEQALAMFTDPERGARACLDWNLYKTAVTRYPNTEAAEYIRGHCDGIYDYQDTRHWQSYYPTSGLELIAQKTE